MIKAADITHIGLFTDIGSDELAELVKDVMPMRVAKGQIVVEKGESSSDVFVVLRGRLVGLLLSDEGKEVAYAEFAAQSYFGEMAALDQGPRSLTITAAEDSMLGRIRGIHFLLWLETYPQLARNVMKDLCARNRRLNQRIFELVVHDVETRVKLMLVRLAMAEKRLYDGGVIDPAPTHSEIAAHVGANREAVSRVFARLKKADVIELGRKKITICDVQALVQGL
ncbi:MAG: Crp/Fnr family transcriptional regulator [Mangrovicoccus sp.]|nr:Crp/Fnr family transcriptional regulator [Mangrovicoccus sp.]